VKCLAFVCFLLFWSGISIRSSAQNTTTASPASNDYERIIAVPRQKLDEWLKSEVQKSQGSWSTQRYHFLVGLSTGHFGKDPVNAIAMRRLLFSLLNDSFAAGDRVTPFAWEMTVWNVGTPVILTESPATRGEIVNGVPSSPRADSLGGHDIPRALYDILTKNVSPKEARSCIILLFTNTNESQAPTGRNDSLFGENNPLLLDAARERGFRLPTVKQSFLLKARDGDVRVDVTALFPDRLESLPNTPLAERHYFAMDSWQPEADRPHDVVELPNRPVKGLETPKHPEKLSGPPYWTYGVGVLLGAALLFGLYKMHTTREPKTQVRQGPEAVIPSSQPAAPRPEMGTLPPLKLNPLPVVPSSVPTSPAIAAEETALPPPVSDPLPGTLAVTLDNVSFSMDALHTGDRWRICFQEPGVATLEPVEAESAEEDGAAESGTRRPEPIDPTPRTILATLFFEETGALLLEPEANMQIVGMFGDNFETIGAQVRVFPNGKLLCQIGPPTSSEKTQTILHYSKD